MENDDRGRHGSMARKKERSPMEREKNTILKSIYKDTGYL